MFSKTNTLTAIILCLYLTAATAKTPGSRSRSRSRGPVGTWRVKPAFDLLEADLARPGWHSLEKPVWQLEDTKKRDIISHDDFPVYEDPIVVDEIESCKRPRSDAEINELGAPGTGLKKAVWGSAGWSFMHAVTFAFPKEPSVEQRRSMLAFFRSIGDLLPCGDCAKHFRQELAKPTHDASAALTDENCKVLLGGRDTLSRWLFEVHNSVNRRIGKPEKAWATVERYYLGDQTAVCKQGNKENDPLYNEQNSKENEIYGQQNGKMNNIKMYDEQPSKDNEKIYGDQSGKMNNIDNLRQLLSEVNY